MDSEGKNPFFGKILSIHSTVIKATLNSRFINKSFTSDASFLSKYALFLSHLNK